MGRRDVCTDIIGHLLHLSQSTKKLLIHRMQLQACVRFKRQIMLKAFDLSTNSSDRLFFLCHSLPEE